MHPFALELAHQHQDELRRRGLRRFDADQHRLRRRTTRGLHRLARALDHK